MRMLNGLDIFSGIGGVSLAIKPWVRTVAYCESSRFRRGVLLSRMRAGVLDEAPIWDDVRTLRPEVFAVPVDIISGGFPCQDISLAGSGAGLAGKRSGLFWEIIRLAGDLQPAFVFLENVPAITGRGGLAVAGAFASLGYDARWGLLSAADVGAPHIRERWWFLAHANSARKQQPRGDFTEGGGWAGDCGRADHGAHAESIRRGQGQPASGGRIGQTGIVERRTEMANAKRTGHPERERAQRERPHAATSRGGWWHAEPDVGRVAHGVPMRVDRISALGDSVVPEAAREAFTRLSGLGGVTV